MSCESDCSWVEGMMRALRRKQASQVSLEECGGFEPWRAQTCRYAKHRRRRGEAERNTVKRAVSSQPGQLKSGRQRYRRSKQCTHPGARRSLRGCQCHMGSWTLSSLLGFRPTHPPIHWMDPPEWLTLQTLHVHKWSLRSSPHREPWLPAS